MRPPLAHIFMHRHHPETPTPLQQEDPEQASAGKGILQNPIRKDKPVTLLDMKEGESAVISTITGGRSLKLRLAGMGIREGKLIRLIRAAPFRGPLLVEDVTSGARTMIGRGMAGYVAVCDHAPS